MKVILTGATGTIGSEILKHCLDQPSITSIVALSRREIACDSSKLTTIIVPSFAELSNSLLAEIVSADAAIWAMGTTDANYEINYTYPHTFYEAFLAARKESPYASQRFRFIRVCGAFTERNQDRSLWFFAEARKLHGLSEARTLELGKQYKDVCQTFVVKPGGVSTSMSCATELAEMMSDSMIISSDKLGRYVASLVVNGDEEEGAILNRTMVKKGGELLKRNKAF